MLRILNNNQTPIFFRTLGKPCGIARAPLQDEGRGRGLEAHGRGAGGRLYRQFARMARPGGRTEGQAPTYTGRAGKTYIHV